MMHRQRRRLAQLQAHLQGVAAAEEPAARASAEADGDGRPLPGRSPPVPRRALGAKNFSRH